jgi:Protein of unknown function (DUF4238)
MPPPIRQQHVVPQFYLKAWCRSNGQLWALEKKSGHNFSTHPRNVAGQRDAYDTWLTKDPNNPESFQYFEKEFGAIEGDYKPVFDAVIASARRLSGPILLPNIALSVPGEYIESLAYFAAVQMMRDMRFRERLRTNWNYWLKLAWGATAPILFDNDDEDDVSFEKMDEDYLKHFQMEFLSTRAKKFSSVLKEKVAVVGFHPGPPEILTSDSPVWTSGYVIDPSIMWDGIDSPSSITCYPLAPDVALIFFDRNFYQNEHQNDRRVRTMSRQEVMTFNQHQVLQAHQRVFSRDGDFAFARQVVAADKIAGKPWNKQRNQDDAGMLQLIDELKDRARSVQKGSYTKRQWRSIIQQEGNLPFGKLARPKHKAL